RRESSILDDILIGDKRIECRLNRGKFAEYELGDRVRLRRDIYRNGVAVIELPKQAEVEITKLENFSTFREMFQKLGYSMAIPRAKSLDEAILQCRVFYSEDEEAQYGVRAVYFKLIWPQV
ncbi:MAG: ASCH domain-containing protein, partial [Candidatus Saccharibacteria bacterium]